MPYRIKKVKEQSSLLLYFLYTNSICLVVGNVGAGGVAKYHGISCAVEIYRISHGADGGYIKSGPHTSTRKSQDILNLSTGRTIILVRRRNY